MEGQLFPSNARVRRRSCLVTVLFAVSGLWGSVEANPFCTAGQLPSGGTYLIFVPPEWDAATGALITYATPYVAPQEPVGIPQVDPAIVDTINSLGFAFAAVGYRKTGLAVKPGTDDIAELLHFFQTDPLACGYGRPHRNYLTGASQGGLAALRYLEAQAQQAEPDASGALILCAPIGDFVRQIGYLLDFRVVFEYFFPGVLPWSDADGDGRPDLAVPAEVIADWDSVYRLRVMAAVAASPLRTAQLLRVTRAAVDLNRMDTAVNTAAAILEYVIEGTNDFVETLGGNPYDNRVVYYRGSGSDLLDLRLNAWLTANGFRFAADPAAVLEVQTYYQTSGELTLEQQQGSTLPLVTVHTSLDPIVPYLHEKLYTLKTLASGSAAQRVNFAVDRYGHCSLEAGELVTALAVLMTKAQTVPPPE